VLGNQCLWHERNCYAMKRETRTPNWKGLSRMMRHGQAPKDGFTAAYGGLWRLIAQVFTHPRTGGALWPIRYNFYIAVLKQDPKILFVMTIGVCG